MKNKMKVERIVCICGAKFECQSKAGARQIMLAHVVASHKDVEKVLMFLRVYESIAENYILASMTVNGKRYFPEMKFMGNILKEDDLC